MLHQDEGGIGKSIPDARKISRDPRDFPRAKPEGNLEGRGKSERFSEAVGFAPRDPRDFPRAKPEGNPEGKANPGSPELLLEVYHSLLLYLLGQIFIPPHKNREGMTIPPRKKRGGMELKNL